MRKKLDALETYRAFAALMIAAVHFKVNSPIVDHFLATGIFVPFFFTLSGFVIYYNYFDKINNFSNLIDFGKKRFLRLYPLHFFFLLIFLFVEFLRFFAEREYGLLSNIEPFTKNNTIAFLCNLFLLQTFLAENTFNTPSWSISAEYYTYLFFGFLFIKNIKNIFFTILIIIILIVLFRISSAISFGQSTTFYSFIDCIYCFLIGVIFCKFYFLLDNNRYFLKHSNLISFLMIVLNLISIKYFSGNYQFFFPFLFGGLILFSSEINKDTIYGRFICNKFFVYLGKISYSIYLSHLFIFWLVTQILRFIFNVDTYFDKETSSTLLNLDIFTSTIIALVCYTITIIFSSITYKYIEIKFYKKGNFLQKK